MGRQNGHVSLIKNSLASAIREIQKARAAGVDLSALLPLLTTLVELATEVLPGMLKRDGLEEAIEKAAKELPESHFIAIDINQTPGKVDVLLLLSEHLELVQQDTPGTLAEQVETLVNVAKIRDAAQPPVSA